MIQLIIDSFSWSVSCTNNLIQATTIQCFVYILKIFSKLYLLFNLILRRKGSLEESLSDSGLHVAVKTDVDVALGAFGYRLLESDCVNGLLGVTVCPPYGEFLYGRPRNDVKFSSKARIKRCYCSVSRM